jgi:hypothetical protein
MEKEFEIGDEIRLDRYSHIDDVDVCAVVSIGRTMMGHDVQYTLMVIDDDSEILIRSTGRCIMESKYYVPCPDEDRKPKKIKINGVVPYWL